MDHHLQSDQESKEQTQVQRNEIPNHIVNESSEALDDVNTVVAVQEQISRTDLTDELNNIISVLNLSHDSNKPMNDNYRPESVTEYDDDEEKSVVIKIIVPGLDDKMERSHRKRSKTNSDLQRNRLYCVIIIFLVLLVLSTFTIILVWSIHKSKRNGAGKSITLNTRVNETSSNEHNKNQGSGDSGILLKTEWPELLHMDASIARAVIQNDRPDLKIEMITEGDFVPMDYQSDRIRIFLAPGDIVSQIPHIG